MSKNIVKKCFLLMSEQENPAPEKTFQSNSDESSTILDPIKFNNIQKFVLIVCNILIVFGIIVILNISTKIGSQVKVTTGDFKTWDISLLVSQIFLFIQLFVLFALLPFTIYDIIKDKYLNSLKTQRSLIHIISGLIAFVLMFYLFFSSVNNESPLNIVIGPIFNIGPFDLGLPPNVLLYFGIPPEVLISVLVIIVVLYSIPAYVLTNYYKL